jgi:hypothetical protein
VRPDGIVRFTCSTCGRVHEGLPDLSFDAPIYYGGVPEGERDARCTLSSDLCVIDDQDFFARGVLEVPIKGTEDVFGWGVWVSLSRPNFDRYVELFDAEPAAGDGPWFGWLSNRLPGYPETLNLRTHLHLRPSRQRPRIVLEPTDHPLAVHQREGIALEELLEIIGPRLHDGQGDG